MSKSSPICISDDSEDEQEESCSDHTVVEVFSEDDNSMSAGSFKHFTPCTPVKIEKDAEETTPMKSPLISSPKIKITVNKERLKWLSGVVRLASVSPVKTESTSDDGVSASSEAVKQTQQTKPSTSHTCSITQDNDKEDYKLHQQSSSIKDEESSSPPSPWLHSPLSSKHLSDKPKVSVNKTPKKSNLQRAIESPRKAGIFGSPLKSLKQTHISVESFSPKKLMRSPSGKTEDTSHHTPPLHACQSNGYAHKLEKQAIEFSEFQLNVLEGIREEGLVAKHIDMLLSFVSKHRKPPPEICFYLINEALLKAETISLATKSFWALKRIQALHPVVPEKIEKTSLTWETIEMIVERMELKGCRCKKTGDSNDQPCVRSFSAFKALEFLITVMESEIPRRFCVRRTSLIAFRLLSLERSTRKNANQVVWWLKESIATLHCKEEDPTADFKFFQAISDDPYPLKNDNYLYQAIGLLQRLLQLSLNVSQDPESCATELVGELLFAYNQLQHLECRTIFLQSICSHMLRSKFLEKYLEVYCNDTEVNRDLSNYSGIKKIVQVDFERLPQKRDPTDDTSEERKCHPWHRSLQDCEEMIMVVSYSLQSYLFCHHKKLQCSPKRTPLTSEGEEGSKQANGYHLSISDVDEICNMGDKVLVMAGRLMSLCQEGYLNARTNQLVELLSAVKLWDPW